MISVDTVSAIMLNVLQLSVVCTDCLGAIFPPSRQSYKTFFFNSSLTLRTNKLECFSLANLLHLAVGQTLLKMIHTKDWLLDSPAKIRLG